MEARVAKLSRSSRWLLAHMLGRPDHCVSSMAPLPTPTLLDQPKMAQMNGLVRRMWVKEIYKGIFQLTPSGRAAAEFAKTL